jgi:hypothetical protein
VIAAISDKAAVSPASGDAMQNDLVRYQFWSCREPDFRSLSKD